MGKRARKAEMEASARERLLDAMLEELAEKGYRGIEVESARRRAGLERGEWLAEFADVDACLFAAYEQLTGRLTAKAAAACAGEGAWPERVRAGLEALLAELACRPGLARVLTRSFPAIGPAAHARYQAFVEGFAPLLEEGRELSGMGAELPAEVELLAAGAAEAIVFEEIEAGRVESLPARGPAILFSVLVPFLGPEAASAEMARAA